MAENADRPRLRIVRPPHRAAIDADAFRDPLQSSLFPEPRKGMLIFVYFPDVTDSEFLQTLRHAEPAYVLDFRIAPRFDIGRLNRKLAFDAFLAHGAEYVDLMSSATGDDGWKSLIGRFGSFLRSAHLDFKQPLMFLVNKREPEQFLTGRILDTVAEFSSGAGEVFEVPHYVERPSGQP